MSSVGYKLWEVCSWLGWKEGEVSMRICEERF